MRAWHYNIVKIIKNPDFKDTLLQCLRSLEGSRDHSIVLSMLGNYFNLRNKNFGSNWVSLPTSRVTLYVNKSGIYFLPDIGFSIEDVPSILDLNAQVYASIGRRTWVLTFKKTKSPTKEEMLCHLESQKKHS